MAKMEYSYVHTTSDVPLKYSTFNREFDKIAKRYKDKTMIVFRDPDSKIDKTKITFEELSQNSARIAYGLHRIGVRPKDNIAIMVKNGIHFVKVQHGVMKAGAVLVRMHLGKGLFVTEEEYVTLTKLFAELKNFNENSTLEEKTKLQLSKCTSLKFIVYLSDNDQGANVRSDAEKHPPSCLRLSDLICFSEDVDEVYIKGILTKIDANIDATDTIAIYPTSGSTGFPKLVPITHFAAVNSLDIWKRTLELTSEDIFFTDRPLSHVGGSAGCDAAAMIGCTNVMLRPDVTVAKGNADFVVEVLQSEKCTSGLFFPYLLFDVIKESGRKITIPLGCVGGQVISPELMERALTVIPTVLNGYGSTETLASVFTVIGDTKENICKYTGKPVQHFEAKVVNTNGQTVKVNKSGELLVRGPSVMSGYYRNKEKTKEVFTEDGWYKTGDMAIMNEQGYITVLGRQEELIIRATMNIYPVDVEDILHEHPEVDVAQVIGVPDERLGEEICACVRKKAGSEITDRALIEFCESKTFNSPDGLSNAPKYVIFFEDFPKLSNGKTDKSRMKIIACEKLGLSSENLRMIK